MGATKQKATNVQKTLIYTDNSMVITRGKGGGGGKEGKEEIIGNKKKLDFGW